ncbi:hypothetical protein BKP42_54530 [Rhodococcus erythropolis]|uniref:hypothetical protein n=1 Tax=Rhodococcus erythropolis TaxID=1833 RepID=UPI000BB306AC|nr:hypothetical protein [Rhodococcus erythropolis]PBI91101.1 hypothetical protein BKP42_54530 [Rhodococcus erythropolis]
MNEIEVPFVGTDRETAHIARLALQPVLDSMYRRYGEHGYGGHPQGEIETALKRAGRGSFARDRIELFARYIALGQRPVLVATSDENLHISSRHRYSSRHRHQSLTPRDDF